MDKYCSYRPAVKWISMIMLFTASNFAGADMPVLKRKPPASKPAATQPLSRDIRSTSREMESPAYESDRMSQQEIDACTDKIKQKQIESQSWGGNVNDVSYRLGTYQKEMFEGRCANHPEARQYIASAEKMISYKSDARSKKVHNPAADAKECTQLIEGRERGVLSPIGGKWTFVNNCQTAVEFFWCTDDQCARDSGNTWTIRAGGSWPVDGTNVRWGACRGKDSGGFDRGSQGQRYTCPLLEW